MQTALNISKYIVSKCIKDGEPISNLQLQKILYYIQREFLKKNDDIAFDDVIEAWQFGPVVPDIYYHYCGYGAMPITSPVESCKLPKKYTSIIDPIVEEKRKLEPWTLVNETHKKGHAWDKTYKNGKGNKMPIKIELIKAVG